MADIPSLDHVIVEATFVTAAINRNDIGVEGQYLVYLPEQCQDDNEIGNYAMNIFHNIVPVKMPEDFRFMVKTPDGEEIEFELDEEIAEIILIGDVEKLDNNEDKELTAFGDSPLLSP